MSDVSFIRSSPVATPDAARKPDRSASPEADTRRETPRAPEPRLSNKTTVKTEARTNFSFTYTFIDTETQRVIGQWPAPAAMGGYGK